MKIRKVKPSADEAPALCEYEGCRRPPTHTVRFRKPKEYVCYCQDHAVQAKDMTHGKALFELA